MADPTLPSPCGISVPRTCSMEPGWKCPDPWLAVSIAALRGQMSLAQTGAQACFTPYVTRPLPA